MLQYPIIAYEGDYTDALNRRIRERASHFENTRELKKHNRFVTGGSILDDHGRMIGSMMVVQFDTEDDLLHWMRHEPYVTGNVWEKIKIKPFQAADG